MRLLGRIKCYDLKSHIIVLGLTPGSISIIVWSKFLYVAFLLLGQRVYKTGTTAPYTSANISRPLQTIQGLTWMTRRHTIFVFVPNTANFYLFQTIKFYPLLVQCHREEIFFEWCKVMIWTCIESPHESGVGDGTSLF